jgi:ABC-type methionine transport system ATPase subunit
MKEKQMIQMICEIVSVIFPGKVYNIDTVDPTFFFPRLLAG